MTVNELIAELQVLVAQGHGELDVTTYNHEDDSYDISLEIQLFEGTKKSGYYDIPLAPKSIQVSFVGLS